MPSLLEIEKASFPKQKKLFVLWIEDQIQKRISISLLIFY
ncbi:hypothetical protein NXF25_018958 [Crotalus adamanteus]|uniref:Uncharacterized protein n=1 Tax=Crotalus adamanteus TaxID=8729 RepID=A0AAW1B0H3_CROAD